MWPRRVGWALAVSAACTLPIQAHDLWESGSVPTCVDDASTTCNQLRPGQPQVHDLQGTVSVPDVDWMVVETKARRSYEVDVRGGNIPFALNTSICAPCPMVARVDSAGTVLTLAVALEGAFPFPDTAIRSTVRWTAGASDRREFVRVSGPTVQDMTANDRYEIVLRDTTLAVPRWNSTGSQTTIFLVSNQAPHAVTGSVFFYDGGGVLRHTEPLNIVRNGLQVVSTAALPALAGLSGSATIAHDAGYGGIVGKAVALEPATGFTFDTQMTQRP
jgi:hypothetical protein